MTPTKDGKAEQQGGTWSTRRRAVEGSREAQILDNLRTTSTLNAGLWRELAQIYKSRQDFPRAEVALLGALYIGWHDRDTVLAWFAIYQMNRAQSHDKAKMLYDANKIVQGVADAATQPARLMHDLQTFLFTVEREEVFSTADSSYEVVNRSVKID